MTLDLLAHVSIGYPLKRGPLALYPIHLPQPGFPAIVPGPRAGDEVRIAELDVQTVPELMVENRGAGPVLFLAGETILGGLQNRMLDTSVLVAAGATKVPVSCVERSRWHDDGHGRAFSRSGRHAPERLRRRATATANMAAAAGQRAKADQSAVWADVDEFLGEVHAASPTGDLHAAYEVDPGGPTCGSGPGGGMGTPWPKERDWSLRDTQPLPGQCGYAAVAGGRVSAVELFGSGELLGAYWDEKMAALEIDHAWTPKAKRPGTGSVLRFVRRLGKGEHIEAPGVGLGVDVRIDGANAVGSALTWDRHLVHLTAFGR